MNFIYCKSNGKIVAILDETQDYLVYFRHFPQNFIDDLKSIFVENINDIDIRALQYYKIINNELIKRSQQEIDEIQQYGKILTDSERTLNKLIPSHEEVQKAQNTIEILTLIQEVF